MSKINEMQPFSFLFGQILLLDGNSLYELPEELGRLEKLKYLGLGRNIFRDFPLALCSITSLETVDLSQNQIAKIPSEIAQLTNLCELNMKQNVMSVFCTELCALKKLQSADFSDNPLEDMPEEVSMLECLQELDLSNNQFFQFPKTVCSIPNLVRMVFSQAEGLKVSDGICHAFIFKAGYNYIHPTAVAACSSA